VNGDPRGADCLSLAQENIMSKTCGDMARYNRLRKQKIRMRERVRELRAALEAKKSAPPSNPKA
jgi:hypothetical protein